MRRERTPASPDSAAANACGEGLRGARGLVARLDDGGQRLALVLEVALRGLDEVGNEVVAAAELHVDLRERVLEPVLENDKSVVEPDDPRDKHDGQHDDDKQCDKNSVHLVSPCSFGLLLYQIFIRADYAITTR